MKRSDQSFSKDDADSAVIEYTVVAAAVVLALTVVLAQIGGALTTPL